MTYPQAYLDLLERFALPGCPLCALVRGYEDRYVDSLLYEYSLDPGVHAAFRRGRGLCNHHSWHLAHHHGYSLGVSHLFEAALDELIAIVGRESDSGPAPSRWRDRLGAAPESRLADALEPEGPCPACASVQDVERGYLDAFARYWSDAALRRAYDASHGVCLPHLRAALRRMSSAHARELAAAQRDKWAALKRELDQFQIKSAFNYVGEPFGAEADSWRRAVAAVVGGERALLTLTRPP